MSENRSYLGNPLLKGRGVKIEWPPELVEELIKCKNDPVYFAEKYIKIVTAKGLVPFILRDYQKEMLSSFVENRFNMALMARQSGKTETVRAFILHYILFNREKTVALLANKGETAREILGKIQIAYQHLPKWMQHGVVGFGKGSFTLENGSRVIAASTSSSAIRGYTVQALVIDEAAFIERWDEFYASVMPTITEGDDTKLIMCSTPNGLNHYHKMWIESEQGKNEFIRFHVPWYKVPGRDAEWAKQYLSLLGNDTEKFAQEMGIEWLGSSGTLIAGWKLKQLVEDIPAQASDGLYQYKAPEKGHKYALVADVSHGKGLDYSAFHVIDCTAMPYEQVCVYHSNRVTPTDYASIIYAIGTTYEDAMVLIEVNDIGAQVADLVSYELGYENVIMTASVGNQKRVVSGFGVGNKDKGIRTTKPVKATGCAMLKLLVEQNQLVIRNGATIEELATFSKKGNSYEAEEGKHDDLVMGLVLFGWLSSQGYFKEMTEVDTLANLRDKTDTELDDYLLPFSITSGEEPLDTRPELTAFSHDRDEAREAMNFFNF